MLNIVTCKNILLCFIHLNSNKNIYILILSEELTVGDMKTCLESDINLIFTPNGIHSRNIEYCDTLSAATQLPR